MSLSNASTRRYASNAIVRPVVCFVPLLSVKMWPVSALEVYISHVWTSGGVNMSVRVDVIKWGGRIDTLLCCRCVPSWLLNWSIQVIRKPSSSSLNSMYADITGLKLPQSSDLLVCWLAFICTGILFVGHSEFLMVKEFHPPTLTLLQRKDRVRSGIPKERKLLRPLGVSKITTVPRISSSWNDSNASLSFECNAPVKQHFNNDSHSHQETQKRVMAAMCYCCLTTPMLR